jgi:hypothetical protein
MLELEEMSLEEKKQLLQAIYDSKQSQHQTAEVEETSTKGGTQDVSSTTVEKRNDNNIVVQVNNLTKYAFYAPYKLF